MAMILAAAVAPAAAEDQARYYAREKIHGIGTPTTAPPADADAYDGTWTYSSAPVVGTCSGGLKPTTVKAVCTGGTCDPDAPHEPRVTTQVCGVVCDAMLGKRVPTNVVKNYPLGTAADAAAAKALCEDNGTARGICTFSFYDRDKPAAYTTGGSMYVAGPNDNGYTGRSSAYCDVRK